LIQWLAVSPRYHPQELIGDLVLLVKMLINKFQLGDCLSQFWSLRHPRKPAASEYASVGVKPRISLG
jgi:hypothetical protein